MKSSEMKLRCSACQFYKLITYADGHHAIGCLKASPDGIHAVNIAHMDSCPRSHAKRRYKPVDRSDLFKVLGQIYTKTAATPAHIPLYSMLEKAGGDVAKRRNMIGKTLLKIGLLKIVSDRVPGKRGICRLYQWNLKDFGPVSLALVDMINERMSEYVGDASDERMNRAASLTRLHTHHIAIDEGVTRCELCWMRDTSDCRHRLLAVGIDCKKFNVNTMRYEAPVG